VRDDPESIPLGYERHEPVPQSGDYRSALVKIYAIGVGILWASFIIAHLWLFPEGASTLLPDNVALCEKIAVCTGIVWLILGVIHICRHDSLRLDWRPWLVVIANFAAVYFPLVDLWRNTV
jgi:hypothetical protein